MKIVHFNKLLMAVLILSASAALSAEFELTKPYEHVYVASIMELDIDGAKYDVYFSYRDFPEIVGDADPASIFWFWGDEGGAARASAAIAVALNQTTARFVTFDEAILRDTLPGEEAIAIASSGLSIAVGPECCEGYVPVRWIRSLAINDYIWKDTDWVMPPGGGKPWAIIVPSGTLPNAIDDVFSAPFNRTSKLDVLSNDLFLSNGPYTLLVSRVRGPAEVTVAANNEIDFLPFPTPDYDGIWINVPNRVSFTYTVTDRDGNSASATTKVTLQEAEASDSGAGSAMSPIVFLLFVFRLVSRKTGGLNQRRQPNQHKQQDQPSAGRCCGR
jgi:hypothetical protein